MKKHEILSTLKKLAKSQGMYGRLLNDLIENCVLMDVLEELEEMNFKDEIDLILFLES